jgi:hypothetical protein
LPQDQVFRFQRCSRLEARSQDTENQLEQIGHQDASLRRPLAGSTPNRIFGTHRYEASSCCKAQSSHKGNLPLEDSEYLPLMQGFSRPPSGLAHFRESVVLSAFSPIGGPPFFRPSSLPAFALFVEALHYSGSNR